MTAQVWLRLDERALPDHLGFIPEFLDEEDPDDAQTQLDKNYGHGGGYRPQSGWEIVNKQRMTIQYPGDPPTEPLWANVFRKERIYVYPYGYVLILQPDGSFVCARMD